MFIGRCVLLIQEETIQIWLSKVASHFVRVITPIQRFYNVKLYSQAKSGVPRAQPIVFWYSQTHDLWEVHIFFICTTIFTAIIGVTKWTCGHQKVVDWGLGASYFVCEYDSRVALSGGLTGSTAQYLSSRSLMSLCVASVRSYMPSYNPKIKSCNQSEKIDIKRIIMMVMYS